MKLAVKLIGLRNCKNGKISFERLMSSSTVFGLSSGFGKCGVSVIRVSGPQTTDALRAIVGEKFKPVARYAALKSLYHPLNKELIDKGLVLWFPGPASFTGEDSCEFQTHGSIAVIAAMLDALSNVPGLRMASPGEFTKRAFFGGKLDLTEVEGLADLIHAETESQRKQALLQTNGCLSKLYQSWRKRLIRCAAHIEAYIDFAEDENIEDDVIVKLKIELSELKREITKHLNDQRQGEMLRHGVRTAIFGAPNVGKSSLLNYVCQRKISIVTAIPGTTRDIIESTINIGGYPVIFADTAGLRINTEDTIEAEGITMAKDYINNADFLILVISAEDFLANSDLMNNKEFNDYYFKKFGLDQNDIEGKHILTVVNKIDLLSKHHIFALEQNKNLHLISCKNECNMDALTQTFTKVLQNVCGQPTAENPRLTHSRYREQLTKCIEFITNYLDESNSSEDLAISAQKLRKAIKCIERITGDVSTDDILDVVFRDFCIGK